MPTEYTCILHTYFAASVRILNYNMYYVSTMIQ